MDSFASIGNFLVYIGNNGYGFSKVSNLTQSMEYDSVVEGGRNWSPLFFPKPKSKHDTLTLEHGVRINKTGVDNLALEPGTVIRDFILYINNKKNMPRVYTFDEGVVTKMEVTNLDAVQSGILIETIEISHTGLIRTAGK